MTSKLDNHFSTNDNILLIHSQTKSYYLIPTWIDLEDEKVVKSWVERGNHLVIQKYDGQELTVEKSLVEEDTKTSVFKSTTVITRVKKVVKK
jgi:hypothetical protein